MGCRCRCGQCGVGLPTFAAVYGMGGTGPDCKPSRGGTAAALRRGRRFPLYLIFVAILDALTAHSGSRYQQRATLKSYSGKKLSSNIWEKE